jgi:hypothetical protein
MRHNSPRLNTIWGTLFSIIVALSLNACGDVSTTTAAKPAPATLGPLAILTSDPLPAGTTGGDYNVTLAPNGGTPPYTWSLAPGSPALPNGLAFVPASGKILGVPNAATGTILTNFRLQDSTGAFVEKVLSITVNASSSPLTILSSSPLPPGSINQPYAIALSGSGGTTPYTWSLKAGSPPLPTGLSLGPSGVLSGTPTVTSNATHTFRLTDATTTTVDKDLQLSVDALPLSITTASLPQGTANQNYSAQLEASGGTGAYSWVLAGGSAPLPTGLTLNPATGVISGVPTSTSNLTHTFTVTDSTPPTPQSATKNLTITINPPVPPTINSFTLPTGTVNQPYPTTQMTAIGGALPYTWSVSPALPNGLSLNPSSGVISGTPLSGSNGTTSHTFTVTDSTSPTNQRNSTTPKTLTIHAAATPLAITTSSLPDGTEGSSYVASLSASGGTGQGTYTWSITGTSSTPAPGLTLSGGGVISGTPSTDGSFARTYRVQDNNGAAVTKSLTLDVKKKSKEKD